MMTSSGSLNAARRAADLDALAGGEIVDVLVVGGGVTGTGVALDAAARGLTVALVERRDLAFGTSRWSSKLVHGGLRYLATGAIGIAMESARERGILMESTASHLVRPMPMVVPFMAGISTRQAGLVAAGGVAGDLLRMAAGTSRRTLPRPRRLSAVETARLLPGLTPRGLRGGYLYWDGQLEDDARLVVGIARTAASFGARILTYVEALELDASGARLRDARTGADLTISARHVVNATGVWADTLAPETRLRPSKGAHVIVRSHSLGDPAAALTVPVPGHANRYVFALPQPDGLTYIGLTDDAVVGQLPEVPLVDARDTEFLLNTLSRALRIPLTPADVVGSYAGLRPLLAAGKGSTADLSRKHALLEGPDGVLTIVGGKLTTYRRMAQDTVDRIAARPGVTAGPCQTKALPLLGAAGRDTLDALTEHPRLVRRYGTEAAQVAKLAADHPELLTPIGDGIPTLGVELAFGVAHEGALTVADLLERRTRLDFVPAWAEAARPLAEQLVASLVV